MHFSNYISTSCARTCLKQGLRKISVTPTALKQTPKVTLKFLEENGIKMKEIRRTGRPRKLSEIAVKKILAVRHEGQLSFYKIANLTKIPKSTVFDYCKRYNGRQLKKEDVESLQIKEAHRIFKTLHRRNFDEEISKLAEKGCKSSNIKEIEEIMNELKKIIFI